MVRQLTEGVNTDAFDALREAAERSAAALEPLRDLELRLPTIPDWPRPLLDLPDLAFEPVSRRPDCTAPADPSDSS